MIRTPIMIFAAAVSMAAALPAQTSLELGERPIARAEVIAVVKRQFAEMDSNRDGSISPEEFERYRAAQNARPDQGRGLTRITRSWFERSDSDGDGRISLAEAEARPLRMFDLADANRDGVASVAEQSMAALFVGK